MFIKVEDIPMRMQIYRDIEFDLAIKQFHKYVTMCHAMFWERLLQVLNFYINKKLYIYDWKTQYHVNVHKLFQIHVG